MSAWLAGLWALISFGLQAQFWRCGLMVADAWKRWYWAAMVVVAAAGTARRIHQAFHGGAP